MFSFGCNDPVPAASNYEEIKLSPDVAAEKAAVQRVIEAETAAFMDQDFDKMLSYRTDTLTVITNQHDSDYVYSYIISRKEAKSIFEAYARDPAKQVTALTRSNWNIHLSDDFSMAWATVKTHSFLGEQELRVEDVYALEKVEGSWKIALNSSVVRGVK